MSSVIVIGAGVVGLCCAYALRQRGIDVVVVDRDTPGSGASHGNGGYICPSFSGPTPAPGVRADAWRWLFRSDSPLSIVPRADPHFARCTNDYTSLLAAFQDGRIAMWLVWDSLLGAALQGNTKIARGALAISPPPRGPVNNSTITGTGGWAISKFSPNKHLAATFLRYVTNAPQEALIAQCGYSPARTSALSIPSVVKTLPQAPYLSMYAHMNLTRNRTLTAQAQRISDAVESVINQYLNGHTTLDAAVNDAQQRIDQIQHNG